MSTYVDNMRNGLKPEWQVLNTNGSVSNTITYSNRGVKMRNDQFDITGSTTHFSLLLDEPIEHVPGQFWEVTFIPGELSFGYMQFFLHDTLTDAPTNTNSGPFGISQHWDPGSSKSYLYMQHGSSAPTEDTKIEIVEAGEAIVLRLMALDNGRIKATARADQWDDPLHTFGESNQDSFEGIDLYPCITNIKSYNATDGANLWRSFKALEI
jgi:hypothetical protein